MIFTKMTVIAAGVLAIGIVTAGVGLLAAGGPASPDRGGGGRAGAGPKGMTTKARAKSLNNLKTIGLAMHNFADRQRPVPRRRDPQGRQAAPELAGRPPAVPRPGGALREVPPRRALGQPAQQGPAGPDARRLRPGHAQERGVRSIRPTIKCSPAPARCSEGTRGRRLEDIKDGTCLTIMVVEAARPVPWTKPEDLPFDKEKPLPELGGLFEDGFFAALADGSALVHQQEDQAPDPPCPDHAQRRRGHQFRRFPTGCTRPGR